MMSSLRTWLHKLHPDDPVDLARLMTLVTLLLTGPRQWYTNAPVTVLCILGVLYRWVREAPRLWLLLTIFIAASNWQNLYTADNHKHLLSYWCGAMWLASKRLDADHILAESGRLLVGCVFAFAVLWKFQSPDFLNGDFFQLEFLTDRRFEHTVRVLFGVDPEVLARAREASQRLLDPLQPIAVQTIPSGDQLALPARVLAYWTVFIELSVAVLFLFPLSERRHVWMHVALLVFVLTTYAVVPVFGFAFVLLTMGFSASKGPAQRGLRIGYLAAFSLIYAYSAPFGLFLLEGS
jgi:hypothetical protein